MSRLHHLGKASAVVPVSSLCEFWDTLTGRRVMREAVTSFPSYDQYTTEQLLEAYKAAPGRLRAALGGLSEDELHQHSRPGKWSVVEIVIHMTDSELVGATRMRMSLAQPGAPFVGYNQDTWAEALDYQSYTSEEMNTVLDLFKRLRQTTYRLLAQTPAEAWRQRGGIHPEYGAITLRNLLELYADHGERHIGQILGLRQPMNRPLDLSPLLSDRLY
jgi:uncharacterized damage-inducible protein DinB